MKVAYFLHTATTTDGSSKAFLFLIKQLLVKGVVPLIILPHAGEICPVLQELNIKYVVLPWNMRPSTYPWFKTFKDKILFIPRLFGRLLINNLCILKSILIIRKFKPEIIHTNCSVLAIGYYTARFLKIPHVWHIREYGALDFNYYYYYPNRNNQLDRYKRKGSYTICITKDIQRYNFLTNWENAQAVYDGVLSQNVAEYFSDKKQYILFAGRLENAKGILPLIDAYAQYYKQHSTPLPLHVAGHGTNEYIQLVKNKIQEYGIEDKVILLGMRKDILSLYKEAKALIVPSLSEGFGFITAEAMFCGCLVIGNDTAGTKEQFDNGLEMTGEEIALRYTKQEELVQHLIDVTNEPIKHYEPMILRAQQVVTQLYSTETHAERVYEFYNYILNQNT